jgi:hypothetical protein
VPTVALLWQVVCQHQLSFSGALLLLLPLLLLTSTLLLLLLLLESTW